MSDEHDPILDACLEEILGGQTPPDLAPRIIQAWSQLPPAVTAEPPVQAAPPAVHALPRSVQVAATGSPSPSSTAATRRRARRWTASMVTASMFVAASVIAIGLGVGFALRPPPPETKPGGVARNPPLSSDQRAVHPSPAAPRPNVVAGNPDTLPARNEQPEIITPEFVPRPPFATTRETPPFELSLTNTPRVAPQDDAEIVTVIDTAIRSAWQANGISPATRADDTALANRLFQQVLGRAPTGPELQSFVSSRDKDKRAALVDDLLTREEHVVEFARHWANLWTDSLVGRSGAAAANQANRGGLQQYLRRSIQQAKPWDQIATELLTATGSGEIGSPQYNGAANFLLAHYDAQATRTTAQVARVFLGQRMQCAQCHDHPSNTSLAQNRFWELNTFLRQLAVLPGSVENGTVAPPVLGSRDFHGDGGGDGTEAEVFYETPSGAVKVAYPGLPGVAEVPRSGLVERFDRRAGLARYVAGSEAFRRVVVNRVWSNIFGYGFTSPVDDLGPHNPPSHPALLQDLADQFAAHNYDLRSLIRWMVLSEPFQLGSGPAGDLADAPEQGRGRWFSRAYPRAPAEPMPRESLVAMAKAVAAGEPELGIGTTANIKPSFPAGGRLGTPDQATSPLTIASQTVGQSANFVPAMIDRILDAEMSSDQKLEHLFLVTLQRPPTKRERSLAQEISGDIESADRAALLQIWWALQRSRE